MRAGRERARRRELLSLGILERVVALIVRPTMKTFLLLATALTLVLAQDSASCRAALKIQVEANGELKAKDLASDPTCAASAEHRWMCAA